MMLSDLAPRVVLFDPVHPTVEAEIAAGPQTARQRANANYYAKNKDRLKAKATEAYRADMRAYHKAWRETHSRREYMREYARKWRARNRQHLIKYRKQRWANRVR